MKKQEILNHPKNNLSVFFNILITGCIVFSILLNGLMVKVNIDQESYDFFKKALKSQSAVLGLFTFSSIPLTIVYNLFCENRAVAAAASSGKPSNKQSDTKKNTSSDYSISNGFVNKLVKDKCERTSSPIGGSYVSAVSRHDYTSGFVNKPQIPIDIFVMLILALFILLPRGSIEYSNFININRSGRTGLFL
jgi:hypothetical protein